MHLEKMLEEVAVKIVLVYLSHMITNEIVHVEEKRGKKSSPSCLEGHN